MLGDNYIPQGVNKNEILFYHSYLSRLICEAISVTAYVIYGVFYLNRKSINPYLVKFTRPWSHWNYPMVTWYVENISEFLEILKFFYVLVSFTLFKVNSNYNFKLSSKFSITISWSERLQTIITWWFVLYYLLPLIQILLKMTLLLNDRNYKQIF